MMSVPMPDSMTDRRRARSSTTAAPMSPKTAPEAPRLGAAVASSAPKEPARSAVKYSAAKRTDPMAGSSMSPRR